MAATLRYLWRNKSNSDRDVLDLVCGARLAQSGYATTLTFMDAVVTLNPTIDDWDNVPDGTPITLPFTTT